MRRALIAFDRGDLAKLPFSDDVNAESRLLMRRTVRERVAALAPFLTFDQDPYIVLGDDGRLSWILDAFTQSDTYPYSTHYTVDGQSVNYMRNSVKVVIDAYDGTTTFYVFDTQDPILAAYRGIFPSLFKDASEMPAGLRKHVRYPELLLKLQAEVYGLYHMTNPEVFYNREDLWTVATEVGMGEGGAQQTQAMEPNFVLMKLPGESGVEFVEILPFTPANRNNLIGWIAGRSDGEHYGTSIVYDFPKTKLVDGPLQIEARIDQNAQLSGQLTLVESARLACAAGNAAGDSVGQGAALCGADLSASRPQPHAGVAAGGAGAAGQAGLRANLRGGAVVAVWRRDFVAERGRVSGCGWPAAATAGARAPAQDLNALIAQAGRDFDDYQRLTAAGKLAEAGQKLEALKQVIGRMNERAK